MTHLCSSECVSSIFGLMFDPYIYIREKEKYCKGKIMIHLKGKTLIF